MVTNEPDGSDHTKYNLAYNLFVNKDLYLDVTADKNFAPSDSKDAFFEAEAVTAATDVAFGCRCWCSWSASVD